MSSSRQATHTVSIPNHLLHLTLLAMNTANTPSPAPILSSAEPALTVTLPVAVSPHLGPKQGFASRRITKPVEIDGHLVFEVLAVYGKLAVDIVPPGVDPDAAEVLRYTIDVKELGVGLLQMLKEKQWEQALVGAQCEFTARGPQIFGPASKL
jgi:hypothetical protein